MTKTDAERREALFERCLKDCKTAGEAFDLACKIEGFIECGLDPPDTPVSREKAREMVLEQALEGKPYRTIATELGLSKDAVRRHVLALRDQGLLVDKKSSNGLAEAV